MATATHSLSADPARPRRRRVVMLCLIAWTVFVVLALWWLLRENAQGGGSSAWVFHEGGSAQQSLGDRARDWFRLAHLNFQRIYPWVLLGPYVAWLTFCFPMERGRLRVSLPIHLAACAAFAGATYAINSRNSATVARVVIVTSHRPADIPANLETNTVQVEVSKSGTGEMVWGADTRTEVTQASPYLPGSNVFTFQKRELSGPGLRDILVKLDSALRPPDPPPGLPTMRPLTTLLDLLAYCALAGLAHSVHFYRRYRERERTTLFLESNLAKAKLNALQAQLQPHFLFNSLNAIVTLLRRDPRLAETTLMSLSELLRLTLSQSEKQEVFLREELQFVRLYLDIQQTRFGDRLRFEQDAEEAALDCLVPALLLQPLVENAIRHGIEPAEEAGLVRLTARVRDGRLLVTVEDDGIGFPEAGRGVPEQATRDSVSGTVASPSYAGESSLRFDLTDRAPGRNGKPGTGIGLSNLRARLEALYGADQKLELLSRPGGGVVVRVELPVRMVSSPAVEGAGKVV